MKFDDLTNGQTKALVQHLGGADTAFAILQGAVRITLERISFLVWMSIEIGGVPKADVVGLLEAEGFFVGDWAKDMVKQDAFTVLPSKQTLKLARCTVRDLGFTEEPTTEQLKERIKVFGGALCPAEVGPHLRRQLKDQKKGDIFWLVMEQIADSSGHPFVFALDRYDDGRRWLRGRSARPGRRWSLDDEVVFVLASDISLGSGAQS